MTVINNESRSRFEIRLGEEFAFMNYRWSNGYLALMHTFVPVEWRNKGISSEIAGFVFEFLEKKNLKAVFIVTM